MTDKHETTENAPDAEERGLQSPSTWFLDAVGGQSTSSGIAVNSDSALTMSAVYACVRVLAETIASLPVVTYSKTGKGKSRDEDHPAFTLLRESPNSEMSSYSFIETMMTSVLLTGNAYAEIQRNGRGDPVGLHFIPCDYVSPSRTTSGRLVYRIRTSKVDVVLEKAEILHFAGLSTDGIIGISPIGKMREAIGMGLATQEFGANFFRNATRPSGILETPTKLTDDAVDRLRDTWRESFQGSGSTGSVPILEQGLTWKKMTIDPEDAQFLSTRRFQTAEIARAYRVPLYLLADMEAGSSYSSIEQVSIDFARYSLRPWLVRLEHELNRKLFRMAGDSEHFVEFLLDAILRADTTTRFNAYKIGRDGGWLSINDIRKLENMDSIESDGADQYLQPLNMTTVGDLEDDVADEPGEEVRALSPDLSPVDESTEDRVSSRRSVARRSALPVFTDAITRIVRVETNSVRRQVAKLRNGKIDADGFASWVANYYSKDFPALAVEVVIPSVRSYTETLLAITEDELREFVPFSPDHSDAWSRRFAARSASRAIRELEDAGTDAEALGAVLARWDEVDLEGRARNEIQRLAGSVLIEAYRSTGVERVVWRSEDFAPLDGKVVRTGEPFLDEGDTVEGSGGYVFNARTSISHPPLTAADRSEVFAYLER